MNFELYLQGQALLHPSMSAQDAVKMCFQAAFGAEHAAPAPDAAGRYLESELNSISPNAKQPIFEQISEHICRVNLAAWKARNLPADWLLKMFLDTRPQGENFSELMKAAERMAASGLLPFSLGDWNDFVSGYPVDAPYPVHHSEGYRRAEKPAYRIVSAAYLPAFPLLERMASLPGGVVAIDGRAASGKTTLAGKLVKVTGAGLVCMDDFFLPLQLRTPERLNAPGGNVHYERFAQDVLPKLRSPQGFSYPRFDCSVMAINGDREVAASPWRIVEGSYAHHPELGEYMDIRVFRTVEPDEQQRRILSRNGEAMARRFESEWIPMEEKYFSHFKIIEKADIII